MTRKLPPLKTLEAFVTAGRLLSFGKAGNALGLSPSAISRRIRDLEAELGSPFFIRHSKSVELTEVGAEYLDRLSPAFDAIYDATEKIRIEKENRRLVVAIPQCLAARWLTPRLPEFNRLHSEIELEIDAHMDLLTPQPSRYDIGIFLPAEPWPRRHVEPLLSVPVFPVCVPEIGKNIREPADLAKQTMLHNRQLPDAWSMWFRAAGVDPVSPAKDIYFNDLDLAYSAVLNGLGVGLGGELIVAPYLRSGQLVAPFDPDARFVFTYHLVCEKSRLQEKSVRCFIKWLKRCIAQAELR